MSVQHYFEGLSLIFFPSIFGTVNGILSVCSFLVSISKFLKSAGEEGKDDYQTR